VEVVVVVDIKLNEPLEPQSKQHFETDVSWVYSVTQLPVIIDNYRYISDMVLNIEV